MSDVWPLRILASTSSSGRVRAFPFEFGFIAYTFRTMSAKPAGTRCSPRSIASRNLAEPLERLPLAAERHDVPLEEGDDLLAERASRRDLVDQDLWVAWLRIDPSALERLLRELEDSPAALVLIQKELRINVET